MTTSKWWQKEDEAGPCSRCGVLTVWRGYIGGDDDDPGPVHVDDLTDSGPLCKRFKRALPGAEEPGK